MGLDSEGENVDGSLITGLDGMESGWDLVRDIQVTDGQIDDVGERLQVSKAAGPVFHDLQDAIDSLCLGVGKPCLDEGQDVLLKLSEGRDKFPYELESAFQGFCRPFPEETLRGTSIRIFPKMFELVFENPSSVDAVIRVFELIDSSGISLRPCGRVSEQKPADLFENTLLLL